MSSQRTRVFKGAVILAEWVTVNTRETPEREEIASVIGEVVDFNVKPTAVLPQFEVKPAVKNTKFRK